MILHGGYIYIKFSEGKYINLILLALVNSKKKCYEKKIHQMSKDARTRY
jgi:hypothetical protein